MFGNLEHINFTGMFAHMPLRHPLNKELSLLYAHMYKGVNVNVQYGPMVVPYLAAMIDTFILHKRQYSKIFTIMVSLYFPGDWSDWERLGKDYFSRFMDSLNAKLDAFDERKRKAGDSRSNQVRFCRVYEWGLERGIHIHAVLFFNGKVFKYLGQHDSGLENLRFRITDAWAAALGMVPCAVNYEGLINFSRKEYYLDREAADFRDKVKDMFFHYSYICKAYSKRYDIPVKVFSRSRG
jgi:hypothetical protein